MPALKKRDFLILSGLSLLGTAAYSAYRGVRLPSLLWQSHQPNNHYSIDEIKLKLDGFIKRPRTHKQTTAKPQLNLRAYTPEPSLSLQLERAAGLTLTINNLAVDAKLLNSDDPTLRIKETINGINRTIDIEHNPLSDTSNTIELKWQLPELLDYRFASIGDTGGSHELAWCILRAEQLGARFLLHLGDFNYQHSDYKNTIKLFDEAPIPCYVSIGNHDYYNDGQLYYQDFLDYFGPLNYQFSIGKTRFLNIDTASNILPYSAGSRGDVMHKAINDTTDYTDTITFTHRPLYDPQHNSDHDIGSIGERDWLIDSLKAAGVEILLCGHIHIYDRSDFSGLDQIIAGQGLGHQDLITNSDYSKMAIGHVSSTESLKITAEPLSMPLNLHCHPRTEGVRQSLLEGAQGQTIRDLQTACLKDNKY